MSFKDRVLEYIVYKGLSVKSFEEQARLSNGAVSKMGENTRRSTLDRISTAFPDLNIIWLQTGIGRMINEPSDPKANAHLVGIPALAQIEDTVQVRFFEPSPSATFKEFCSGVTQTPDTMNIIPEPGEVIDELSCVFTVSGESMAPQIQDGAKILCREVLPSRWHSLQHGVIAIVYEDRFVIKRIKKNCLDDKDYILLGSDNPAYPEMEKAYLGNIRCIFQVKRLISQRIY